MRVLATSDQSLTLQLDPCAMDAGCDVADLLAMFVMNTTEGVFSRNNSVILSSS